MPIHCFIIRCFYMPRVTDYVISTPRRKRVASFDLSAPSSKLPAAIGSSALAGSSAIYLSRRVHWRRSPHWPGLFCRGFLGGLSAIPGNSTRTVPLATADVIIRTRGSGLKYGPFSKWFHVYFSMPKYPNGHRD